MKKRQYRSNQGRNPKKEEEIFTVIKIVSIITVIAFITHLILK